MSKNTFLITDFFPKCHPTSASNAMLFEKPIKGIKLGDELINLDETTNHTEVVTSASHHASMTDIKLAKETSESHDTPASDESLPTCSRNPSLQQNSPSKSFVSRVKFVRHHSAPLHHRSPIKTRERVIDQQDLDDMRARIQAYHHDLYKYKSCYSRSPVKRPNIIGDILVSPFKIPATQTPVKSYPTTPAYERFEPLVTTIELPLPKKYEILLEQYKYLDFLVCHTYNNGGISTFEKVQHIIQRKTKRNFTLETLGRIKTVCPTMYRYQQEKIQLPTLSPVKLNYELTIAPTDFGIESNKQVTPSIIVDRIDCFRRALFNIVKGHHRAFLFSKLQLKAGELPDDDNIARWHPDFNLQEVPDIDVSPLPESPDIDYKSILASPIEIRQYAEKTPSQRVRRALFATFSSDDVSPTITLSSPTKEALSIDGISSSLIEKIRSKETNKLLTNAVDLRKQMLSRLSQTIEIIQQFFVAERATSLELDVVAKQIRDCHSSQLSYHQSTETLHFLHTYPANSGWLSIITIRERHFIKINRQKSINAIIETIQRELRN